MGMGPIVSICPRAFYFTYIRSNNGVKFSKPVKTGLATHNALRGHSEINYF
jgi:hypothetical protein